MHYMKEIQEFFLYASTYKVIVKETWNFVIVMTDFFSFPGYILDIS